MDEDAGEAVKRTANSANTNSSQRQPIQRSRSSSRGSASYADVPSVGSAFYSHSQTPNDDDDGESVEKLPFSVISPFDPPPGVGADENEINEAAALNSRSETVIFDSRDLQQSSFNSTTTTTTTHHHSSDFRFSKAFPSNFNDNFCHAHEREDDVDNKPDGEGSNIQLLKTVSGISPESSSTNEEVKKEDYSFQIGAPNIPPKDSFNNSSIGSRDPNSNKQSNNRSKWGGFRIGLKGGGDTSLSNGTSNWGPPPPGSGAPGNGGGASSGGASGGWGSAPPAPNPIASASWGNPNSASQMNADEPLGNSKGPPSASSNPPSSSGVTNTSWAAAAGKGLPSTDSNAAVVPASASGGPPTNGCTASKQLEQLNSVREALFSQDGWGGSFVKQDTAWDTANSASGYGSSSGQQQDLPQSKDVNNSFSTPNGRRNDGTDIWKVNLSGQPPAQKPQPVNPWGHTPQNPTDFKNWGEDDDGSHDNNNPSSSSRGAPGELFWRGRDGPHHQQQHQPNGQSNQFGPPHKDDWNGGPTNNWNDQRRDIQPPNQQQQQQQQQPNRDGWGTPNAPPNMRHVFNNQWPGSNHPNNGAIGGVANSIRNAGAGAGWGGPDGDSPTLSRRPVSRGIDDGGTSLWGKVPPGQPIGSGGNVDRMDRGNAPSNWQDMPPMPTPTPMRAVPPGPPGPPNSRMGMPGLTPGAKEPWGNAPIGHRSTGWGEDAPPPMKPGGWADPLDKRDMSNNGWGNDLPSSPWQGRNPVPRPVRISPSWDDNDSSSSHSWGVSSNNAMNKSRVPLTKDIIWNSKQFRMLADMGYDKNDIEGALRRTYLNLEDALDILRYNGMPRDVGGPFNHEPSFESSRRFPNQMLNYPDPLGGGGGGSSNPMLHKMLNGSSSNMSAPPPQQPRPSGGGGQQQPSAHQLRILVQQIQMAVQAGRLNPQILNQPLAPQTLILLNQLLQQIKTLQGLQIAHAQKGVNAQMPPGSILSVNITKTKQSIVNLQNQISAQQANYLKSQQMGPSGAMDGPSGSSPLAQNLQDAMPNLQQHNNNPDTSGSRLLQWKLSDDFAKAPGSNITNNPPSKNLLIDDGPWGNSNSASGGGGWPEKQTSEQQSSSNGGIADNFGIPEFEPGKPWKGPGLKNPDEDPNLTPGSLAPTALQMVDSNAASSKANNPLTSTSIDSNALGLPSSSTWSFGNKSNLDTTSSASKTSDAWATSTASNNTTSLTPMGRDLWGKAGRGGPPGLVTNSGGSNNSAWPVSSSSAASNGIDKQWSSGLGPEGPTWLLLKNLTAQIDGATLKTLCMQRGPLKHFHLYLNHSLALVNYNSSREASKAQKALNNCLLGNTTIMATSASDGEVAQILQSLGGQNQQQRGGSSLRGSTPSVSSSADMWGPITSAAPSSRIGSGEVWGSLGPSNEEPHPILLPDLGI